MPRTINAAIRATLRRLGYRISRIPQKGSLVHGVVRPLATYSPWNGSDSFLSTYEAVRKHTRVDIYRCWELWTLVEQSAKLSGSIIEIGVWRGGTGALLAQQAARCGIEDPVYLCDTFRGVVKAGQRDNIYQGGEHADTTRADVESLISERLGLSNVRILEGIFPDDTAHLIDDRETCFRLCHIDVDVYQSAKDIIDWIWSRMVIGGIVVYDDYGFEWCEGVTEFVNEQLGQNDRLVMHNLNGHAVVVKIRNG